jgi:hypothetical protein
MKKIIAPSELVSSTLSFYRQNFRIIFVFSSIGFLIVTLVSFIPDFGSIISEIFQLFLSIVLIYLCWYLIAKQKFHAYQILHQSLQKFWIYLAINLLVIIVVVFGLIFFIIPGIIFYIMFYFARYIILLENEKIIASFVKAKELIRGHGWAVFWNLLFSYLFFGAINAAISLIIFSTVIGIQFTSDLTNVFNQLTQIPQDRLFLASGVMMFVNIFFTPIFIIIPLLLYKSLKQNIQKKKI